MGRPKKDISPEQVENLAAIQCTDLEICAVLGISHDTLMRRKREPAFMEALENGRAKGRASLRRAQFKAATSGNTALLVWLGKQFLGQSDKLDQTVDQTERYVVELPPEVAPDTWQGTFRPSANGPTDA